MRTRSTTASWPTTVCATRSRTALIKLAGLATVVVVIGVDGRARERLDTSTLRRTRTHYYAPAGGKLLTLPNDDFETDGRSTTRTRQDRNSERAGEGSRTLNVKLGKLALCH